ncbi:cyclin-like protein [Kalaharituber pfeilii]|nr:cyclin-like protein [Kalaharituber pfeilii]
MMLPPQVPTMPPKQQEYEHNLSVTIICRECKEVPANIVEEFSSGDMVCGSCGLILGDRIVDTRSEWRTFSNDDQGNDDPSRVGDGANPLLNGAQLETMISFSDGGSGRSRELHRAQSKSNTDKSAKTLLAAYKEIGAFCDSTNLPKTVSDTAKHFFKLIEDAKAFKGKPQEAIIAGCIFIACRQCHVPRTFKEIYALTKVPKKEIGRIFKQLEKFLTLQDQKRLDRERENGYHVDESSGMQFKPSTNAGDLMIRFCNSLGLSQGTIIACEQLAEDANAAGTLAGRSPISTAAACIFMISHLRKEPKTAKEISQVAGVSDGTIRNAYRQLYNEREKLIRPSWIANGKGDPNLLPAA